MGMGAGMGGGGHANNPTFMFQARCGPRTPRQLRGARRIARRTAKKLRGAWGDLSAPALASHPRRPLAAAPASPHPVLVAQADWNKNKWKGAVFVLAVTGLGCWIPYKCAPAAPPAAPPPPLASPRAPAASPSLTDAPPPLPRAMDFAQKKAGVEW